MNRFENELKILIIETLNLEDLNPEDIVSSEPLFEGGLGLDSIDALELGLALFEKFGVEIEAEDENTQEYFYSVQNLAQFVANNQPASE